MIVFFAFRTGDQSQIDQVGPIPSGLMPPRLVDTSPWPANIGHALPVAIMGYAINLSLAKSFSDKHGYQISPLQEALASGTSNAVGSFFGTITSTASLSRSSCQDSAGGRTQVASIVSALLVLLCLLVVGQYFAVIPKVTILLIFKLLSNYEACLAGIVVVNLRGMFRQFLMLPPILKHSTVDGAVWLVSFVGTVVFGMIPGLACSLGAQVMAVVYRSTQTKLLQIGHTELISYTTDQSVTRIYKLTGPLDFTSGQLSLAKIGDGKSIILDMSACSYIDWIGLDALKQLIARSKSVSFCCVNQSVLGAIVSTDQNHINCVYPTISDCIALNPTKFYPTDDEQVQATMSFSNPSLNPSFQRPGVE